MSRRRRLGQHRLIDEGVADRVVEAAEIRRGEVVFELGAGTGQLTSRLCAGAGKVISCEVDPAVYDEAAMKLAKYSNLELIRGDGLKMNPRFDVFVSSLPYSESRRFIYWLIKRKFRRAVVMVQKEFADKLLSKPGERLYRSVSALAQYSFKIRRLFTVDRSAFNPQPKVLSEVLVLEPRADASLDDTTVGIVRRLFSFRGRRLSAALKHLSKEKEVQTDYAPPALGKEILSRRVEALTPSEVVSIAGRIAGSRG